MIFKKIKLFDVGLNLEVIVLKFAVVRGARSALQGGRDRTDDHSRGTYPGACHGPLPTLLQAAIDSGAILL